jgi:hypothetical protein
MSVTPDEPGHFACGLQYLAKHIYRYEAQHPPLARAMMALAPYLDGVRPGSSPDRDQEGAYLLCSSGDPDRLLSLMRLGILPFFLLASLVVYFWARHHFGNSVAVITTALFTMLPPVLGHAGLATTDMGLTACLGAAFWALIRWAEAPNYLRSLLLGLTAAMAALSKFTALGFLPAAAALALLFYLAVEKPGMRKLAALARARAAMFSLAVCVGAFVIWAAYWFSFGKAAGWSVSLPAPEFFDGILSAMRHNQRGHPAYLLGQVSDQGWWYYFPVVLAVKTPLAFLLLLAFGVYVCWRKRAKLRYGLPLAFSLGILVPAMTSRINIGVRHILPVYMGFSIVAALAVVRLANRERTRKWAFLAAGLMVLWMAVSGAMRHPDYLAYFNELAANEPERVLVDSDLDWGQDTKLLARRLVELGANEVSFGGPSGYTDCAMKWLGLPSFKPLDPAIPAEGWTAVGPTLDKVTRRRPNFASPAIVPWYDRLKPKERVGSVRLYYVPPGSLRQAR